MEKEEEEEEEEEEDEEDAPTMFHAVGLGWSYCKIFVRGAFR